MRQTTIDAGASHLHAVAMASTCAPWVIAAGLVMVACSEPAPPGPAVATVDLGSAPTTAPGALEPGAAGTAAASGEDLDAGKGARAWREHCTTELEAAIVAAAAHEPALRVLWVQHESHGKTDALSMTAFPPTLRIGGLLLRVERTLASGEPQTGAPHWQTHAESHHGGYHASFTRRAGDVEATMLFDGLQSTLVQVIAPLFQAAIERCDAMK